MTTCPFPRCSNTVGDTIYFCTKHWLRLTKAEREAMWDAYRESVAGGIGTTEARRRRDAVIEAATAREPELGGES